MYRNKTYIRVKTGSPLYKLRGMATRLDAIQASQFSILRLAIHHMAVMALEDTRESRMGVLLLVKAARTLYRSAHDTRNSPSPSRRSAPEHQEMGYAGAASGFFCAQWYQPYTLMRK